MAIYKDDNRAFYYVDGIPTKGKWIDMDYIDSTDEVLEELAEAEIIPRNEDGEPEYDGDLLVADAEGLCEQFLDSHGLFDMDDFTDCRDFVDGNKYIEEDAVIAYIEWTGSWNRSGFKDDFIGAFDSEEDYAEHYCEECMEVPDALQGYIDYKKLARDLFIGDYFFQDGYVFRGS